MEIITENIQKLHSSIASIFGINAEDIKSKCRTRKTADARKVFVYFLRSKFKLSNRIISREINKKESCIGWMISEAESLMKTDVEFMRRVNDVRDSIETIESSNTKWVYKQKIQTFKF